MPTYYYKVKPPAGNIKSGVIEAADRQSALQQLKQAELYIINLEEQKRTAYFTDLTGRSYTARRHTGRSSKKGMANEQTNKQTADRQELSTCRLGRGKIGRNDLAVYCRHLSLLLASGIAILKALNLLAEQITNRQLQQISYQAAAGLQQGLSLKESFAAWRGRLDDFFLQMAAVGEMGGCLEQVLEHLAVYYEQEHELSRKIKSALFYPCTILALALILLIAALTLILPTFDNLLALYGSELPLITQLVMSTSTFLRQSWWIIGLGVLLLTCCQAALKHLSPVWARMTDAFILKIPLAGHFIKLILISRFCRTLSLLLGSGVSLIEAINAAQKVCRNLELQKILGQTVSSIKEGKGLAEPLGRSKIIPPLVVQMVLLGEETGRLEVMLGQVAAYYEKEITVAMEKGSAVIEPFLLLTAGLLVGFIIISIMLPLFSAVTVIR